MHLPLLHISNRQPEPPQLNDPLGIGMVEGRDLIPWLADPKQALARVGTRTRAGDVFSLVAAAVGSEIMYFSLMSALFSGYDRQKALKLAGVILPSVFINQLFKARFRFERPPQEARHPLAFVAPGDFTFPSGHAQNAVLLGLFMALRSKRKWVQATGLSLASSIPMSRVYLGVHYPRDILAGAALGVFTLVGSAFVEKPFIRWWDRAPRGPRSFAVATGMTIVGVLSGSPLAAFPLGVSGGLALGHDLSGRMRYKLDASTGRRKVVQGTIGMVMTVGLGFAIRPLVKRESPMAGIVAGTLVGVGLTYGVPLVNDFMHRFSLLLRKPRRHLRAGNRHRPVSAKARSPRKR